MPPASSSDATSGLNQVIERHWGFRSFRPLQEPAMRAVLEGRDSLVVLPTGGGKSLCYQAPAVLREETTLVISPLISLMKDQVDGLRESGVAAVQIDSSLSPTERSAYEMDISQGAVRLVFVSPERLVNTDFYRLLQRINVRTFAIDEAHCISHWGHDFRPEYRQLNRIREFFPEASVHGYTATATEQVRADIVKQLGLKNPAVLVGNFDRPNLSYRVLPRHDLMKQVLEVLGRHPKEAGIIYCIRRADVEELTAALQTKGCKALPYHAGMDGKQRRATQDTFAAEECDLVVATVAFGMGIDRSNIRFVLHTGMPKSIEHYQQETGRAGRDGLEAECVLLHSGQDFLLWKWIIEKSAAEPGVDPGFLTSSLRHLNDMDHYCRGAVCRHKALVQYFGQTLDVASCAACDLCLGDNEEVADAVVLAQKIISCVYRLQERFGVGQVVSVLRGENTEKVRKFSHDKLSTYGLLNEHPKTAVRDWIYQLVGQQVLEQKDLELPSGDRVPILCLNPGSWEVLRKERTVRLMQPVRREKGEKAKKSQADDISWEGVDRELFEALREVRRQLAVARQVPPYIIFNDSTLRQLAAMRPSSIERMRYVSGIGDAKLRDFGPRFLEVVDSESRRRELSRNNRFVAAPSEPAERSGTRLNPQRQLAFDLFRRATALDEVVNQTGRSLSTINGYLAEFIREERPTSIEAWVSPTIYALVATAARQVGADRLKPIFLALGEKVSYEHIRLVLAHLK